MSFDIDSMAPRARQRYIRVGAQFGSDSTLAQANQTLQGWKEHGAAIAEYGFLAKDANKLEQVRALLTEATLSRETVKTVRKKKSKTYDAAIDTGKRLRERGRIVLDGVLEDLEESGTDQDLSAADLVESKLEKTSQTSNDADELASQLELLLGAFQHKDVVSFAAARNAQALLAEIQQHCGTLRKLSQERFYRPGTPEHTERLDTLDGIIVTLARRARRAAESASKALGQPAILTAFNLNAIYNGGSSSTNKTDEATPTTAPSESQPTTAPSESQPT